MRDDEVKRRFYTAMPAGGLALRTLIGNIDIGIDPSIPSAAIRGRLKSRLVVNPVFLAKHCRTDAHFFMLVMHELMHITLGHTRLFGRMDAAANIAFDAVINAILCHRYPQPEYTSFFRKLYPTNRFPECLLRPPDSFPDRELTVPAMARAARSTLQMLYRSEFIYTMSYHTLFWLLSSNLRSSPPARPPLLLGDHETPNAEHIVRPTMKRLLGTLQEMMAGGDRKLTSGQGINIEDIQSSRGIGQGGNLQSSRVTPVPDSNLAQRIGTVMARIRQVCGMKSRATELGQDIEQQSVIPDWSDRNAHAQEVLLHQPKVLWKSRLPLPRRRPKLRIYLDVSGSMEHMLPRLFGAMGQLVVHDDGVELQCFSTEVHPLSRSALVEGRYFTTGGTNINCVQRHERAHTTGLDSSLVLTDGELNETIEPQAALHCLVI